MSWEKEIEEINSRRRLAREQGGKESVEKHHARGKLTARERIDRLLDTNSFKELGSVAGTAYYSDTGSLDSYNPANYIVGIGKVDSRNVAVGAEDFTLKGGSPNTSGLRKSIYAEHLALNYKIPLIRLLEGGGGSVKKDVDENDPKVWGDALFGDPRFAVIGEAMGKVPVVSAALGPVAGFPAGRLVSSHFSVMTKETAQVMVAGPAVVKRALGIELTKEELGSASIHCQSGVVDNLAKDEDDAFKLMRNFLSYLPSNAWERAPTLASSDPTDRNEPNLNKLIPKNRKRSYDVYQILHSVFDDSSFFEINPLYGPGLVIGLARMNGQPIGVAANNCNHNAGAMTAEAAKKMRRLIELCDTFHLPIINFVDEPGFMIGLEAEKLGTIRYGMAAVAAAAQASVPWASVRIRKSFGVASAAHFGPNSYILDWPSVESGALPVEGGVAVAFHRQINSAENPEQMRQKLEQELLDNQSPFAGAESFSSHDIIEPAQTRAYICQWIDWIQPLLDRLLHPVSFSLRP
ncbi:MAG: carboxyl transferase domain-containing protein [Pseudomonadota bacterium]|nr:carboxyl transferase domain-containing protein [Pseudomonadota bacterium]